MSNEVYDFNIGHSTAYAYAKASGDLPEGMTPEEYGELLASYATVGQTAVTAAQTATTKASEAATSATTATNKASEATTAATTATTKAGEASTSASTATSAKDTAVSASQTATTKAGEATTAAATATSAKTDAVAANTAAQSAKTAAQTAQTGAETAAASVQSSAAQIATNAEDIDQLKSELSVLDAKLIKWKTFSNTSANTAVWDATPIDLSEAEDMYIAIVSTTGVNVSTNPVAILANSYTTGGNLNTTIKNVGELVPIRFDTQRTPTGAVIQFYRADSTPESAVASSWTYAIYKGVPNKSSISKLEADLSELRNEVYLSPRITPVEWEYGSFNNDGTETASTTYVRNVGFISLKDFEYIHISERSRLHINYYDSNGSKVGEIAYGGRDSEAQNIYLTAPTNAVKIRVVQLMHDASWSTTIEDAENDVKFESVSYIKQAIDLAKESKNEIGVTTKAITVPAGTNHSASIGKDRIALDDSQRKCYISVESANHVSKDVQAWGFKSDGSSVSVVSFYSDGKRVGVIVDEDVISLGFTIVNSSSAVEDTFTITIESYDAIEFDNYKNDLKATVDQARHVKNFEVEPLTLLHFSDLHEDTRALYRISRAIKEFGMSIDGAICTGDMTLDTSGQIASWWDANIMTCIGNHDCASKSGDVYDWTALSMADRDAYYIAPFESNWGITHTSGTSYYYKDYSTQKIRLIVMDAMLYNDNGAEATAQTAWLASLLADAITNNLHVLIAIHAPHGGATAKDCSFSRYDETTMPTWVDCNTPQTVIDTVATAIGNGLKFIGYICGHTHQDNMWDAENDGKQIMYCITCANVMYSGMWRNSDLNRTGIADAYNIVTIDTAHTLIKIVRGGGADLDDHMRTRKAICFNYSTGEKVGEVL